MPVVIDGSNTPTAGGVGYGDGTELAFTSAGTAGGVLYSAGSSAPAFSAAGTAGQPIVSGGAGAPAFRPYTLPAADGSANQVLQTNGSGALSFATAASALTLLATATASASATVSLETGIGATYDGYFVTFLDVTASSDDVELRVKLKFSGTYADSLTSQGYYKSSDSGGSISGLGQATCTVNRYRVSIYTATGKNVGGELWFNRTANAKYQMLRFQSSSWSPNSYGTDVVADTRGSGFWNNTNAVQGIQFYMSTGNIQSGTFRLYGIQNS